MRLAYWQIILTAKIVVLRSSFTDYRFRVFVGKISQRLFLRVISFDDARISNEKNQLIRLFFRIGFSPDDILTCKLGKRNIGRWIRINKPKTISLRKLASNWKRKGCRTRIVLLLISIMFKYFRTGSSYFGIVSMVTFFCRD